MRKGALLVVVAFAFFRAVAAQPATVDQRSTATSARGSTATGVQGSTATSGVDPVALVDPFIGTTADVNAFPGADLPFGMVQWSPDTVSRPPGGGYNYKDSQISGFSLTHLSGPGCRVFGNFPILPTVGEVRDPAHAIQSFDHASEAASPGWYAVTLAPAGVRAELTVTQRTGIGRFNFPRTAQANLIFNVSGSQGGDTDASIAVTSPYEVTGSATTGHFCGGPGEFTVYFVAQFDRMVASSGTWMGAELHPGSASATGNRSGGWVTFDASDNPQVLMKVGVSFVSVAGARANLGIENGGWDLEGKHRAATSAWQTALGRLSVEGGAPAEQHIFYTAFYHALLHPNVISDADGSYLGFDEKVHRTLKGRAEYANFSDWDIYRTQLPLVALLFPHETSDMLQSLVDTARDGGWLPKWPLANTYTSVMNGDSADPIIASAHAFGARDFDERAALAAMIKGATRSAGDLGQGWYVERLDLDEYLRFGYVTNAHTNSVSPLPNGASETLEYAVDDFSIARLAEALGDAQTHRLFAGRARNWANLYDSAAGLILPRDADGAFFQLPSSGAGQSGFQEGNAAQYTWLVPHDLRGLFDVLGGDARVVSRLDDFFSDVNAGPKKPQAWMGNEPSILSPWLYLSAGAPWKTQNVVRQIETTLYLDEPAGEAGNDDLGTMSAWYVWAAIGLYPQTPGVPLLDIGSPLFTHVVMMSEDGRTILIDAPQAATGNPFVQAMRVNGIASTKTWLIVPRSGSLHLEFDLGPQPNMGWGSLPGDGPPSWGFTSVHVPPATTATLSIAVTSPMIKAGEATDATVEVSNTTGTAPVTVAWRALLPKGVQSPGASGIIAVDAGKSAVATLHLVADPTAAAGFYDVAVSAKAGNGAALHRATDVLRVVGAGPPPKLAYVLNFSEASMQPLDLHTLAMGPAIVVGADPGDAAVSPDGNTVYVANQGSNTVSVVDARDLRVVDTIAVGKVPAGIRIAPDGRTVWVADYGDDDVRSIDVETHKVSAPIPVGKHPEEIAIASDGAMMYVVNQASNSVTPVDVRARIVRAEIPVGRQPLGIVLAPDGKSAYVTNMGSSDVTPIDLASNTARPAIPVGMTPQQPAISPDGLVMFVPNSASNSVTPIDLRSGVAGAPFRVGNGPFYIIFSDDGRTAFCADTGDNTVVPIDVKTRKVGDPIPAGSFPIAVVR